MRAEPRSPEPSDSARKAVEIFKKEGKKKILELGCGQGRGLTNNWSVDIITYEQIFK